MPKFQIQITEITPADGGANGYEQRKTIYDQTLDALDVAKVVIAANQCIAKTEVMPVASIHPQPYAGSGVANFDARGNITSP